jgi:hypothetical protein
MKIRTSDMLAGFVVYAQLAPLILIAMACLRPWGCDIGFGVIPAMIIGIPMHAAYQALYPALGAYAGLSLTTIAAAAILLLTKIIVNSPNATRISAIAALTAIILLSGA